MQLDEKIISQLAELMYENWNNLSHKNEIKKRINGLLHRKRSSNVINEYKDFLNIIPNEKKKSIPLMTVILVLALCRRNLDEEEVIYESLEKNKLIPSLYGGMSILLNGKSKQLAIKLKWQDNSFENKYEFINRFQGEFLYWDYIELFIAAKIIQRHNQKKFEELVLKDRTRLLLLNLTSGYFNGEASEQFILTLIKGESELDRNAGFFLLTFKLNRYIRDVIQYEKEKELGINRPHPEINIIERQIKKELERIESLLIQCDGDIKVSLIINYLLSEPSIFMESFGKLLLDPNHKDYFINEIRNTKKINTLEKVYYLLNVVSNTRVNKKPKGYSKLELYNALVDTIIIFIRDRKGIYQWANREEEIMQGICELLPQKPKYRLFRFLIKESQDVLCSRLDELVRFDIFLKDKNRQNIINGMLSILKSNLDIE